MRILFFLTALLLVVAGVLAAQTCAGNQDFFGAYLVTAHRPLAVAGTAPSEIQYSSTPVGQLVRNANGVSPFALTARVVANGAGELLAAPPAAQYVTTRVGTYRVNGDCTMSLRLADGFATGQTILGDPLTQGEAGFQGVLQDRGNEASFIQTSRGAGTLLRFERPHWAQGCTNNTLSGVYAVDLSGVDLGAAPSDGAPPTPWALVARFVADGAGALRMDTPALESSQPGRQITGSYRVEADCTGSAEWLLDGRTWKVSFVLIRGGLLFGQFQRAMALFTLNDSRYVAIGRGR